MGPSLFSRMLGEDLASCSCAKISSRLRHLAVIFDSLTILLAAPFVHTALTRSKEEREYCDGKSQKTKRRKTRRSSDEG